MSDGKYWTYAQRTGELTNPEGKVVGRGYSGAPDAKNDPAKEAIVGHGPIPRGLWSISAPHTSPQTGLYAMALTPVGHDAHGRSAFEIHGDSILQPGAASHGCIILLRRLRELIWNSVAHLLLVVEG